MPRSAPESEKDASTGVAFGTEVSGFDEELYEAPGPLRNRKGYVTSINPSEVEPEQEKNDELEAAFLASKKAMAANITAPKYLIAEAESASAKLNPQDPFKPYMPKTIAEQQNSYLARGRKRVLSPLRAEHEGNIAKRTSTGIETSGATAEAPVSGQRPPRPNTVSTEVAPASRPKRKRRWDVVADSTTTITQVTTDDEPIPVNATPVPDALPPSAPQTFSKVPAPAQTRWDAPVPVSSGASRSSRWDATPGSMSLSHVTKKSRWDETPLVQAAVGASATPIARTGSAALNTPLLKNSAMASDTTNLTRWQADIEMRNRPLTDQELDELLPSVGYTILEPPDSYKPVQTPARLLTKTPAVPQTPLYSVPTENGFARETLGIPVELPDALKSIEMKPEDYKNFAKVLDKNSKDEDLPPEEQAERKIMRLLLKIKNGTPNVRKVAMRQISEKARDFGAGPLLKQILPLLMSPTLEHQERHLYVKVIDRILHRLRDLVRPHVRHILVVIEPMLIDDDYYARVEGREIISNLAKAAGLPTMISTMRPDIDHQDEFVRNTTARAFAVVTSALGIPSMLPFLRAVCGSKKSWEARHTGIKTVQQIAILMGVALLPHLRELVEIIQNGLQDEQGKVRLITAHALANLAEAAAPYGIESFESVSEALWSGILLHRGKTLAAFLKAIGFMMPLMEPKEANEVATDVNPILIREFKSPDEEMKTVVLKVVMQCVSCSGVEPRYVREDIAPEYFRCFWIRRMALDRRNFRAVVDTTLQIAMKIGVSDVLGRLVGDLKDESDPYRRMVLETVENVTDKLGLSGVNGALESRLIDGLLFAFQAQGNYNDSGSALRALSVVIRKLSRRAKPYLQQIVGIVKWRLNNKSAKIRENAADLVSNIATVIKTCDEDALMGHMGTVLFEYLGEEFPDVLGSILRAMTSIVEVIGINDMQPPINELLPRLTPILKNRHEKVQENCIILVGRIANKGAHFVSPKEWMRICFELLELLKAPIKAIRKSAVATFGYIAKAIGPSNVLTTLLNNLKVQERTQRVCTTVAIAIVAETCQPYTVLPSMMNEYRIPELHVQNGILKSLSFLFQYIRDMAGDYIYAVTPILEDALIDRDLVHRQTACTAVGHLALGVRGLGLEDALVHLLNHLWPNIFETSPHVINAVISAIQGCAVALGPGPILMYLLQGLFHPAKKVRDVYWRIYNGVYIYAQEGLVPSYPSMGTADLEASSDDEFGNDRYERHELFLVV
eukprot:TRINITY_DN2075_c0_g1_i1.p1 TRINITY_DN2075_c0_g1~~TRINITY_DN2075_c0_g1_i1.p1  ORF type:complete len:1244 (+),score=174.70 TRINITY_DN2075_c0_g1_i1:300-4031(+)